MNKKICLILTLIIFSSLQYLSAEVNPENGNFYIGFNDIYLSGIKEHLILQRTYNSRTTNPGWFGIGWSSTFETNLTPSIDGTIIVHENGQGTDTVFWPKQPIDAKAAAQKVVNAIKNKDQKLANQLITKLETNKELRDHYAHQYGVFASPKEGILLTSQIRGKQTLIKKGEEYIRTYDNGITEFFNKSGYLIKIKHPNGYQVVINYHPTKKVVTSVQDNEKKEIFFDFDANFLVKSAWTNASEQKATYEYSPSGHLIKNTDLNQGTYTYEYDNKVLKGLTKITFPNKTSINVTYKERPYIVEEMIDEDNFKHSYTWGNDPKNPELNYYTIHKITGPSGVKSRETKYEYFKKVKESGEQYLWKAIITLNGDKTETIYNECCHLPLQISNQKVTTTFKYDDYRLLEKRSTTGQYTRLKYDSKWNKISEIESNQGTVYYKYDTQGRLEEIRSKSGIAVKVVYNNKGLIKSISDKNPQNGQIRTLSFDRYNTANRPEIVSMDSGQINIHYKDNGEIKKVSSKQGEAVAIRIQQVFTTMMALIRPASVSLTL